MDWRVWLLWAAIAGVASPGWAVTISYGDCDDLANGGTVVYEGVSESNAGTAALYNAPTCIGNLIDFDPTGFEARDDTSGNVSPDQVEGMLDFTIQAIASHALTLIEINEGGDRQVFGFGTAAHATATMTIDLSLFISDGGGGEIAIGYQDIQAVSFALPGDHSPAQDPWQLGAQFALADILLDACLGQGQYDGNAVAQACGATTGKVAVHVDNLLEAFADDGALAFINKKETESLSITTQTEPVPEPATGTLVALGLLAVAARSRRPFSPKD